MNTKKHITLFVILLSFFTIQASAAEYTLDTDHTEIGFAVKHMVITKVKGAFTDFDGEFVVDEKKGLASVKVDVKVSSIDTRITKRDDHLRSPDFFEVAKYPNITFMTTSVENAGKNAFTVLGDLTIRDITRTVKLTGAITVEIKDPWGNKRIGIVMKGKINRKDFGLTWNKVLENGGLLIGSEVDISLEGEGILKK